MLHNCMGSVWSITQIYRRITCLILNIDRDSARIIKGENIHANLLPALQTPSPSCCTQGAKQSASVQGSLLKPDQQTLHQQKKRILEKLINDVSYLAAAKIIYANGLRMQIEQARKRRS